MAEQNLTPTEEEVLVITPTAIVEAKKLMKLENKENLFLRLDISQGGCSGMSYSMAFDDQPNDLDREFDFDGLKVRVDLKALVYLKGCTVDYETGLMGGGFKFVNPNARRSCGCGSSFTC